MIRRPPRSTLSPNTPLFRSQIPLVHIRAASSRHSPAVEPFTVPLPIPPVLQPARADATTDYYEITQRPGKAEILPGLDRKSTRLNSSHANISYAVFCLKKKK